VFSCARPRHLARHSDQSTGCQNTATATVRNAVLVGGVKRSRTAQGVVAERAVLADMGVVSDPFAQRMLSPAMAVAFLISRQLPYRVRARSVTLAGLAGRVMWFDGQMTKALDAGIRQIAVIGAGYDSRAWRFRRDDVRFFELDHPGTQQDKRRRAPGAGPTYVTCDLTSQDAAASLREHGLDITRPCLFIVEGVTMYLPEKVVRRQLAGLAQSNAAGSRLAVDFHPPRDAGTSRHRRQQYLQRLARAGSGEAFRLTVEPARAVALVEASGWDVNEETSLPEAARALVPRESGLPVDAVNEHKTLVSGRLP
jgi:methyltransferase (TIGR00027 family)